MWRVCPTSSGHRSGTVSGPSSTSPRSQRNTVKAFALVYHESELGFVWLDFIATRSGTTGSGLGGTLYERVRRDARAVGAWGVLFECLPDDPELCPDPVNRRQNAARLRFYEGFGARPVIGTEYETPLTADDDEPPYLVVDDLGSGKPLGREGHPRGGAGRSSSASTRGSARQTTWSGS